MTKDQWTYFPDVWVSPAIILEVFSCNFVDNNSHTESGMRISHNSTSSLLLIASQSNSPASSSLQFTRTAPEGGVYFQLGLTPSFFACSAEEAFFLPFIEVNGRI